MNPLLIISISLIIALGAAITLLTLFAISHRLMMIYNQLRIITELLLKADRERGGHEYGYLDKYRKDSEGV